MAPLAPGARQLPVRHISIRVPWNDTGWDGRVCQRPSENGACLILKNIREKRKDDTEEKIAGASWQNLSQDQLPPCFSERGGFMAPYELTRIANHPYTAYSNAHQHLAPTPFRHPPFSAAAVPFGWMLSDMAAQKIQDLQLGYRTELEDAAHAAMGFPTSWTQDKYNQLVLLDTFFSAIQQRKSLCLFYAKATPFTDDPRRVIIGVGWVTGVGNPVEYRYSKPGSLQSMLWERSIAHSIRPNGNDGFLMPYHELMTYLENHPDVDPAPYVAFVPDDHFWAFSYGAEHVSNDGAIGALLACARALQNSKQILPGAWDRVIEWINDRLNELWRMRGPCPGLGAALTAFGVEKGTLLAYEIERLLVARHPEGNVDPWPLVDTLMNDPTPLPAELRRQFTPTLREKWRRLPAERRALLKLLSRFDLLAEQAIRFYVHEDRARQKARITVSDAEILANPYQLFECDRWSWNPVGVMTVDRGLFPDAIIRDQHPLPLPSRVDDPTDPRRVRALVTQVLEFEAYNGNTLAPRAQVIQTIRDLDIQPSCPIDGDLMDILDPSFEPLVKATSLKNGEPGYQLDWLDRMGSVIRTAIERRLKGMPHKAAINWRALLDAELDRGIPDTARQRRAADQAETDARIEKTAALEQLFAARLSVLIGPAGTGKTTLLSVLCSVPQVRDGGILLLAPTGKARVRLEQLAGVSGAKTIAQLLLPLDRYDPETGRYRLSDHQKAQEWRTVIIDEASMLTEDQLAAVLDGLANVERLILVGDPRQLPPIGAGRPFLDVVRRLAPADIEAKFPRVGASYAELTIRRRHIGVARDDLLLADWFSGRLLDPGADEIWNRIGAEHTSDHLRFVRWDSDDELHNILLDVIVDELKLAGKDDPAGFEQSLGGTPFGEGIYFHVGRNPGESGACARVEDWQILTPVRGAAPGSTLMNRLLQEVFRAQTKHWATHRYRKIPKPMGPEEILYGDKVICTANQRRKDIWPESHPTRYIANGEIGIVVGQYKGKSASYKGLPWKLEVEFASQPGYKYGFHTNEFGEDRTAILELAYALTIHKTQGSEFGLTIVVLPNPCRLLSRELLYTALTRQKDRIVILHQGDQHELRRYTTDYYSETARRLTNLFVAPQPVVLEDRFLEDGLIHKTMRGESVRSKSEVIIANMLYDKGIRDYQYERGLRASDGSIRYPDFTIEDAESGVTYYWEHLGMLRDPQYRQRWQQKLAWYQAQGILPLEEGGGPNGTLMITQDDHHGGIDSAAIAALIARIVT